MAHQGPRPEKGGREVGIDNVDLLAGLDQRQLDEIRPRLRVRHVDAGRAILTVNDMGRDVFLILEGSARATLFSPTGREVAFRDLRAGDSFGELSAIDNEPRSANVIALSRATIASLSAEEFKGLVRRYPQVAENTLRKLAGWVRSLSERVFEFTAPVPVRICAEITRLAHASMIGDNIARLHPSPKHADIAARINTHREAVSRTMSNLRDRGILKRGRGELIVTDVRALERHLAELEKEH